MIVLCDLLLAIEFPYLYVIQRLRKVVNASDSSKLLKFLIELGFEGTE
jgi:hypothetical protein